MTIKDLLECLGIDIELSNWQIEMLEKMWADRDKIHPPFLPRGHAYSEARLLRWMVASVLTDIQRVQNIEKIHKDMLDTDSVRQIVDNLYKPVKPDGYSAQIYVIDESPEILEKAEKENLWRKNKSDDNK